jgi:hypothetical protein
VLFAKDTRAQVVECLSGKPEFKPQYCQKQKKFLKTTPNKTKTQSRQTIQMKLPPRDRALQNVMLYQNQPFMGQTPKSHPFSLSHLSLYPASSGKGDLKGGLAWVR